MNLFTRWMYQGLALHSISPVLSNYYHHLAGGRVWVSSTNMNIWLHIITWDFISMYHSLSKLLFFYFESVLIYSHSALRISMKILKTFIFYNGIFHNNTMEFPQKNITKHTYHSKIHCLIEITHRPTHVDMGISSVMEETWQHMLHISYNMYSDSDWDTCLFNIQIHFEILHQDYIVKIQAHWASMKLACWRPLKCMFPPDDLSSGPYTQSIIRFFFLYIKLMCPYFILLIYTDGERDGLWMACPFRTLVVLYRMFPFIICLILMNYLMEFYFIGFVNAHLPGCFCPWTFRLNIGLNTSPSDSFVSYLNSHLGYSAGEFQALQLIVLAVFGAVD